tara:strand:- start:42 stop:341 length:300 start_codon:yes stop_codon:yes gene_type:complete
MDIATAILAIKSDAQVSINNEDIEQITWHDGNPTNITNQQILDKQVELKAAYDAKQYQRDRQKEYPDAIECVHALLDGGDTLTDLQAKRTTIKDKYPKS